MATVICFKKETSNEKKPSQPLQIDSKSTKAHSSNSQVESSHSLMSGLVGLFGNHDIMKKSPLKNMEIVLRDQQDSLQLANKTVDLASWNYSDFSIVTEKELLEVYHAPKEFAGEGDFLILFHKKFENKL